MVIKVAIKEGPYGGPLYIHNHKGPRCLEGATTISVRWLPISFI